MIGSPSYFCYGLWWCGSVMLKLQVLVGRKHNVYWIEIGFNTCSRCDGWLCLGDADAIKVVLFVRRKSVKRFFACRACFWTGRCYSKMLNYRKWLPDRVLSAYLANGYWSFLEPLLLKKSSTYLSSQIFSLYSSTNRPIPMVHCYGRVNTRSSVSPAELLLTPDDQKALALDYGGFNRRTQHSVFIR